MKYRARKEGSLTIVEIEGNMVGGPNADEFRLFVGELIEDGSRHVIFDLSRVRYVASPGAGMIIGAFTTLRNRGGGLKLVVSTERVKNLIHLIQLYRILEVHETLEAAIESFQEDKVLEGKDTVELPKRDLKSDEAISAG